MRIYVGNLQREFSEGDVRELFCTHGQVDSVAIIRDHDTGRSKGLAFVEMPVSIQAKAAISALNGQIFHQPTRTLTVNEARPRQERSFGGGTGGFGNRGGGGLVSRYGAGPGSRSGGGGFHNARKGRKLATDNVRRVVGRVS